MRLSILAILMLFISTSGASAAIEFVVVTSNVDQASLQPGSVLNSKQTIKLPAGSRVTVLSESGSIVILEGPYSGTFSSKISVDAGTKTADRSSTIIKISKFVTRNSAKSNVIGASRGINTPNGIKQSVWLMAVDSSGHRCIRSNDAIMWRRNTRDTIKVSLRSESAKRTGLLWENGKNTMPLPSEFIEDGILIIMKIDIQPRRFNLHVLPATIKEKQWGKVLLWMIENNCSRQSSILIDALHHNPSAFSQ